MQRQIPDQARREVQQDWRAFDRDHLWHPYTSMVDPAPATAVVGAKGVHLELEDGRRVIDGMSSWWSAIHGYNHPVLNRALEQQSRRMAHVMFGGISHRPAAELGARLIDITPQSLQRVFFADSGSVAVEVAIKMALQYWQARGMAGKQRLLTVRGGYHGDTFGAMAVCDPVGGMHGLFAGVLAQHVFAPRPECRDDNALEQSGIEEFERLMLAHADELAAVILEPVVQGAGGMHFYCPLYLSRVRELCDRHGVLLILDEIATGFGRTGRLFACEHAAVQPDLMCVGKALTGGYLTLAATLATTEVADTISGDGSGVFMHGPTFMANPLACAVAGASIDLLLEADWQARVAAIESGLRQGLAPCAELPGVRDVRVLGAIGVVELERDVDVRRLQPLWLDHGVWLRPFRNLVYSMPPYIISPQELGELTGAITAVLADYTRS